MLTGWCDDDDCKRNVVALKETLEITEEIGT